MLSSASVVAAASSPASDSILQSVDDAAEILLGDLAADSLDLQDEQVATAEASTPTDPVSTSPQSTPSDMKRTFAAISASNDITPTVELSAREKLRAGLLQRRAMSVASGKDGGSEKRGGATYQEVVAPVAKRPRLPESAAASLIAAGIDNSDLESPCNVDDCLEQADTEPSKAPRATSAAENPLGAINSVDQDGLLGWDLDWSNDCAVEMKGEGAADISTQLPGDPADEDWTQSLYTMLDGQGE